MSRPRSRPLREIAKEITTGRLEIAKQKLSELPFAEVERNESYADQFRIFATAMAHRVSRRQIPESNIYLQDHGTSQIQLFNLLASKVPLMSITRKIINSMLLALSAMETELTLIDIGIGSGTQEVTLIQELHRNKSALKKLTIVAIECQASSLITADTTIRHAGIGAGLTVDIVRIPSKVEEMSDHDWAEIGKIQGPKIALSSFALHHVSNAQQGEHRDQVLRRLARLPVKGVVLAEPNSNHLSDNYLVRFDEAWHHFGATFDMIDRLDLSKTERKSLKQSFFGREILDILGVPEPTRTERHERITDWWKRLHQAGFKAIIHNAPLPNTDDSVIEVVPLMDHVAVEFNGVGILSIISARPR